MLTDAEIQKFIEEPKALPCRWDEFGSWLKLRKIRKHPRRVATREIRGETGRIFKLTVRENLACNNHFSVIVAVRHISKDTRLFRLNGWHAPHTNKLEKRARSGIIEVPENQCHIHYLTERYQKVSRMKGDHYAVPTNDFKCLKTALEYIPGNFGFYFKHGEYRTTQPLFD